MKQLFLIFMGILFGLSCRAEEKDIPLDAVYSQKITAVHTRRSIELLPHASHDGNTVYIYPPALLEDVEIIVEDALGNVVYEEQASLPASPYQFVFDGIPGESYVLEISYGDKVFEGHFQL